MKYVRSAIFAIFFALWTFVVTTAFWCLFYSQTEIISQIISQKYGLGFQFFALKYICGIDYKVTGLENVPEGAAIIACKHQSAWETIIFHLIFKRPVFVLKQELLSIPGYGRVVKHMSSIPIDRNGGGASLKKTLRATKYYTDLGRKIVIFPQGTRVPFGGSISQYPYHIGFVALHMFTKVPMVPVALNSGKHWSGKGSMLKNPGTITIKFLPAINFDPKAKKEDILSKVENSIETESSSIY